QLDGVATNIVEIERELIAKIVAASQATGKLAIRRSGGLMAPIVKPAGGALSAHSVSVTRGNRIVAIGCSTGGPQALMEVLPKLPADFPAAIVIVQHMPKTFTKPFAERMNQICPLEVKEAVDGDEVRAGLVLIAPGGVQFRVKKKTITTNIVSLSPNYEKHLHAPAADIMLQSVAALYGERGIGIILTGMGHDGLEGMKAIKSSQGRTIVQDEKTCIVYGMPKAVVEAGCADKVVPLPHIVGEVLNMV
ncbi:MAG TPA: CheB methylesterase domain-containing protein, partial [Nitrospira sp.]